MRCSRTLTFMDEMLNARSLERIGRNVRLLRTRRDLTQGDLADLAGVSRTWLNQIENGAKSNAELGSLLAVLDALGATLMIRDEGQGANG